MPVPGRGSGRSLGADLSARLGAHPTAARLAALVGLLLTIVDAGEVPLRPIAKLADLPGRDPTTGGDLRGLFEGKAVSALVRWATSRARSSSG